MYNISGYRFFYLSFYIFRLSFTAPQYNDFIRGEYSNDVYSVYEDVLVYLIISIMFRVDKINSGNIDYLTAFMHACLCLCFKPLTLRDNRIFFHCTGSL